MGFFSIFKPILSVGGGIVGGIYGGPAGAMAGASAGSALGSGLEGAFGGDDSSGGALELMRQRQALYQKLMGELPTYQGPPPGQGLMPQDLAAMRQAQQHAGQFAQGREQAAMAQDRMMGGGAANSGKMLSAQMQAGQGASERLNQSDMAIAGHAAQRDAQNRELINQFNQQNMYSKIALANGQSGAMGQTADLMERNKYAQNANQTNMFNNLGAAAMYGMQAFKGGGPGPNATGQVPTNESANNIGIDTPWASRLPTTGATEMNTTAGPGASENYYARYGGLNKRNY